MLSGVLLLDKPVGYSSTGALGKCKWLLQEKKAGHTGTLDPFATGLLPLVFGEATKFARFYLEGDKTYQATMRLGQNTPTGDTEVAISRQRSVHGIDQEKIINALTTFVGPIKQIPPMYSALKRDGKPLYELAREGIEVERAARDIHIHTLVFDRIEAQTDSTIDVQFTTKVSKGTYIRVLAEDIGEALGCGAHLIALRRTVTTQFDISQAVTVATLEALPLDARRAYLLDVETLVRHLPSIVLTLDQAKLFSFGQNVVLDQMLPQYIDGTECAIYEPSISANRFLGVAYVAQKDNRAVLTAIRLMRT